MTVSKRLRYEVLRRDNHACRYCGVTAPDVRLTVDHVTPVALGGSDLPANLVTACEPCNSGKTSSSPDAPIVDDVNQDALRWAAAMHEAIGNALTDLEDKNEYVAEFADTWDGWKYPDGKTVPRPPGWERSVSHWYAIGVPTQFLDEAIGVAMRKRSLRGEDAVFRYMAGVVWNLLTKAQEEARDSLAGSGDAAPSAVHCTYRECLLCQEHYGLPIVITKSLSKVIDATGREWLQEHAE